MTGQARSAKENAALAIDLILEQRIADTLADLVEVWRHNDPAESVSGTPIAQAVRKARRVQAGKTASILMGLKTGVDGENFLRQMAAL